MTKLEKVIAGLEHCKKNCAGCPYEDHACCADDLNDDAIELIKAQQWVSVKDRLPDPNTLVLWCELYSFAKAYPQIIRRGFTNYREWDINIGKFTGHVNNGIPDVTVCGKAQTPLFWMPLPQTPELPKDGEDDDE